VRVKDWCPPKVWATRLARKVGPKKARVALARKLAVILHRIWLSGEDFRWTKAATA
jgi:transposase